MKSDLFIKLLFIVNFTLIGISALALLSNNGYEVSIYTATPSYVWYFLVSDIFLSMCVIVYQAYVSGQNEIISYSNRWWIVGMLSIMLVNAIILLLPVIRGYEIYGRWDSLTHVGYVKDILQSNEIPEIIYPAVHILIASISMISNIREVSIINFMVPIFLELYILYMYCLAKTVFVRKGEIIISTVASSVLFLSYTNYQVIPNTLSILALPLVFYAYLNIFDSKKGFRFKVILIIFIIFYPFFHPLTTLILVITFIGTYLLMLVYNKRLNLSSRMGNYASIPALIGSIVFILWIANNHNFWNDNIHQIANLFTKYATVQVESKSIGIIFEKLNMNILDIFELFIKIYGHIFIYLIISCIAGIIILRKIFWHKDKDKNLYYLYFLLGWFSTYNLFLIQQIFSTVLSFGFWRIIMIMIVITPIFIGYMTNQLNGIKGVYILVLVLFISSVIGIFNTFPSPYTLQTNQQVTKSEIVGMSWYYFNKNISVNDINIKSCFRFADFILGSKTRDERGDILTCERVDSQINSSLEIGLVPKHFAYTNFSKFSDFTHGDKRFKNVSYMPIFKYEIIYYTDIYPQLDEFNKNDFGKLNHDISLEKIYSDDGVEIWKLR